MKAGPKILLVSDDPGTDWQAVIASCRLPGAAYRLLTLGFSPDLSATIQAAADGDASNLQALDTRAFDSLAQNDARDAYLGLMHRLPRQKMPALGRIEDRLTIGWRNIWWYLNLTEKNIWTDPLIHRLFAFERAVHAFRAEPWQAVGIAVKDPILGAVLSQLAVACDLTLLPPFQPATRPRRTSGLAFVLRLGLQVVREVAKLAVKRWRLRRMGLRPCKRLPKGTVGFFTMFPGWWQPRQGGTLQEVFFRDLPQRLAEDHPVRWLVWLEPWRQVVAKAGAPMHMLDDERFMALETLLLARDCLALLAPGFFLRLYRMRRLYRASMLSSGGVDLTPLVWDGLESSLLHPELIQSLLMEKALARLPLESLRLLVFRLEFQPFERALLYSCRHRTVTVGYQNVAVSPNFLNYVFLPDELGGHWRQKTRPQSMPLPDYIITSGTLGCRYLEHAGYPASRLTTAGGLRFMPLYEYRRHSPSRDDLRRHYGLALHRPILLVATSALIDESLCLLSDALPVLARVQPPWLLVVKCHPNAVRLPGFVRRIEALLVHQRLAGGYRIVTHPGQLYDYIHLADAAVFSGGAAALEALALGVMPLVRVTPQQFSHHPLGGYPQAALFASDRPSFVRELERLINGQDAPQWHQQREEVLDELIFGGEPDPVDGFWRALIRLGLLAPSPIQGASPARLDRPGRSWDSPPHAGETT